MEFSKELHGGVEYRFDPLTGHQTRINPARATRLMQSACPADTITTWIESTRGTCPFCPERILSATPSFAAAFCSEGRIRAGEGYIFPNLHPFSQHHAVATLSSQHFLDLDQFDETLLASSLRASRDYFLRVYAYDHTTRYPIYLWNYLPPSAGSIIHPHIQIMAETEAVPELRVIMDRAKSYSESSGRNYWDELLEVEKRLGERYIGAVGNIHLIASYAPRGFRELTAIVPGLSSFSGLDDAQVAALAGCFSRILKCYKTMGVGSFNLVSFSSALQEPSPHFSLHFKIISRPYPQNIYTNDTGPFERLYDIWVIDTLPEETAATFRAFLRQ